MSIQHVLGHKIEAHAEEWRQTLPHNIGKSETQMDQWPDYQN